MGIKKAKPKGIAQKKRSIKPPPKRPRRPLIIVEDLDAACVLSSWDFDSAAPSDPFTWLFVPAGQTGKDIKAYLIAGLQEKNVSHVYEGRDVFIPADDPEFVEHWTNKLKGHAHSVTRFPLPEGETVADLLSGEGGRAYFRKEISKQRGEEALIAYGDDAKPRKTYWLWPDHIPIGGVTILAGKGGVGKSTVSLDFAARVTTGDPFPLSDERRKPAKVLLISCEDVFEETVMRRLKAAGANLGNVLRLKGMRVAEDKFRSFVLRDTDVAKLERTLTNYPGIRLIIVDSLNSYLGSKIDASDGPAMHNALNPLGEFAQKHKTAVLILHHFRKGTGAFSVDAMDEIMGSAGIVNIARLVWVIVKDRETRGRLELLMAKSNICEEQPGFGFTIEKSDFDCGAIKWEDQHVDMHADDALEEPLEDAIKKAADWIKKTLKDGPMRSNKFLAEADRAEGISRATLKRAKEKAGAISKQIGKAQLEAFKVKEPGHYWMLGATQKDRKK